jgi:hypothetical protein
MVRSAKRVSNHEATDGPSSFETPAEFIIGPRYARTRWRLLRMRGWEKTK